MSDDPLDYGAMADFGPLAKFFDDLPGCMVQKVGFCDEGLRDFFAGQAMSGILACPKDLPRGAAYTMEEAVAIEAYRLADAMMKARSKT